MNALESQTEPLTRRVATGLGKIGLAIKSRAWKEAGVRRITPLQAQTLTILRMRTKSTATVSEIGEELAVALPTASEVLRVLEQRGLIKKQRSRADARTVMVSLTTKGRRKADVAAGWPDFLAAAADVLPPAEQESLLRALIKMIRTLQEQGDIPIAKMCVTCQFFHPNVHEEKERPHHCELVDAAFGDRLLRIECPEHQVAEKQERDQTWERFMNGA
ncbi:MAG TPA: MarR family winged helix-turn-helix transcriptional regulator [Nitrospiraceae bacterium]|nr:MarR family winged helix-turn-helix transcriptional regulator [Nitrospiraceae bacterium]